MTTHLWNLLAREVNRKAGRFQKEVIAADMARATGLSPQVISKWRNRPTMPTVEHLAVVRDRLGIPWPDLLDAMLADKGYLPEPGSESVVDAHGEDLTGPAEAVRQEVREKLSNRAPKVVAPKGTRRRA